LKYTGRSGFVLTEFLRDVPWAGPHNTINCPFGHHIAEARWVREHAIVANYSLFWFRHPKAERRYTWWPAQSALEAFKLHGQLDTLRALLPHLEQEYWRWAKRSVVHPDGAPPCAWQAAHDDGEENSIGLDGCRPTINAALHGEANALAVMLRLSGEPAAQASRFDAEARRWQAALDSLWHPELQFFVTRAHPAPPERRADISNRRTKVGCLYCYGRRPGPDACPPDWPAGRLVEVRELQGLTSPWYHGAGRPEHVVAFRQLRDADGFAATWGATTAERRHRCYNFSTWCQTSWHGPVWPFESAKLGTALIAVLQDAKHRERYAPSVGVSDFGSFLRTYSRMHTRGRAREVPAGEPFVGESFHGDDGYWLSRELMYQRKQGDRKRGDHYFHSSFCDLVLSGLVGLRVLLPASADSSTSAVAAAVEVERTWRDSGNEGDTQVVTLVVDPLVEPSSPEAVTYFFASAVHIQGVQVAVAYDGTATGARRYGIDGLAVWVNGVMVAHAPNLRRIFVRLARPPALLLRGLQGKNKR